MRNIVFGDTGGWLPQLLAAFDELGINAEESTIPEGMRVIHLGDLIHKGAFSSQLLAIVTGLMVNNPGQWVQLMGNHEAQHIPGAPSFWACDCDATDVGLMNLLREEGLMKPVHAVVDSTPLLVPGHPELSQPSTQLLFSHGGLTEGFWEWKAEGRTDPREVAHLLNELPIQEVTAPGILLGENVRPRQVGPVWAVGNTEVFQSWRATPTTIMPFAQLHGHTTSYSFDRKQWWPGLEEFRKTVTLVPEARGVVSELNNNLMLGLDPGFSVGQPRVRKQPWFEFETKA